MRSLLHFYSDVNSLSLSIYYIYNSISLSSGRYITHLTFMILGQLRGPCELKEGKGFSPFSSCTLPASFTISCLPCSPLHPSYFLLSPIYIYFPNTFPSYIRIELGWQPNGFYHVLVAFLMGRVWFYYNQVFTEFDIFLQTRDTIPNRTGMVLI